MPTSEPKQTVRFDRAPPEANLYQYLELTTTQQQAQTALANECALALSFNGLNHAVMMVSPNDLQDFVLGFSLSCGVVASIDEIYDLRLSGCGEALQADIQISSRAF
jgi:FdhD protein